MVGHWVIAADEGRKVEEFIDNVKAFAYFPIAVAKDIPSFTDGRLA
jgi:hypothetical protein